MLITKCDKCGKTDECNSNLSFITFTLNEQNWTVPIATRQICSICCGQLGIKKTIIRIDTAKKLFDELIEAIKERLEDQTSNTG